MPQSQPAFSSNAQFGGVFLYGNVRRLADETFIYEAHFEVADAPAAQNRPGRKPAASAAAPSEAVGDKTQEKLHYRVNFYGEKGADLQSRQFQKGDHVWVDCVNLSGYQFANKTTGELIKGIRARGVSFQDFNQNQNPGFSNNQIDGRIGRIHEKTIQDSKGNDVQVLNLRVGVSRYQPSHKRANENGYTTDWYSVPLFGGLREAFLNRQYQLDGPGTEPRSFKVGDPIHVSGKSLKQFTYNSSDDKEPDVGLQLERVDNIGRSLMISNKPKTSQSDGPEEGGASSVDTPRFQAEETAGDNQTITEPSQRIGFAQFAESYAAPEIEPQPKPSRRHRM